MVDNGLHIRRNQLIPLSDGVYVAADVYLPDTSGPCPALFAYTVYRKDDLGGSFITHECRFFARHGYACVLADFRGLGNSEGVAWDAMDARESKDAAEIVEWIADQPWMHGSPDKRPLHNRHSGLRAGIHPLLIRHSRAVGNPSRGVRWGVPLP